jgi:hypothetical protein
MSDPERRGRTLFFVVVTLLILDTLWPPLVGLWQNFPNVAWFSGVIRPLIYTALICSLWKGEPILVQLVGWLSVISGLQRASAGLLGLFPLVLVWRPEAGRLNLWLALPGLLMLSFGILRVISGFLLLFSPSLKAFFNARQFSQMMVQAVGMLEQEKPAGGPAVPVPTLPRNEVIRHPEVDFDYWSTVFPMEMLINTRGPQRFASTDPNDPLDLWKVHGTPITSPAHLCMIELVRKQCGGAGRRGAGLPGPAVPVDLLLWSVEPAKRPWLTRLGGTPHRESAKPWPMHEGRPCTFVAQFCFVDSTDIVSDKLPGKVMLVFFAGEHGYWDSDQVHIEFSAVKLRSPMTAEQCPRPGFVVPQLSGHIHRTVEYPRAERVFYKAGHWMPWYFAMTRSTKIGRGSFELDEPVWRRGEAECLCALHSLHYASGPHEGFWPLIGMEAFPDDWPQPFGEGEWGRFNMSLGDVGCLYFLIDGEGAVTAHFFSH